MPSLLQTLVLDPIMVGSTKMRARCLIWVGGEPVALMRECPDGPPPPPLPDAQLIGDTMPPGFDGAIPDWGNQQRPDTPIYDGPIPDLGALDATPPPDDAGHGSS